MLVTGVMYIYMAFFPDALKNGMIFLKQIIEATNIEAFKLALRAQARPH